MLNIIAITASLAGLVAAFSIPDYGLNRIQARSDRGDWSDTSDSSSGSLSSGSNSGGNHYMIAKTKGLATVTYKKKGTSTLKADTGPEPSETKFSGAGKARVKIQTHDNDGSADMKLYGGKARMKVNSERPSQVGVIDGPVANVQTRKKASRSEESTHSGKKGWIYLRGKGKARGSIAPNRQPAVNE